MSVYYSDDLVTLHHGDCVEVMRELPESSVDAVVTDPPYGIGFMGKAWDGAAIAAAAKKEPKDHTKTRERSASMHAGSYDLSLTGNTAFQLWFTEVAAEALRVLKPGGHLLAFGGTRTWHRLAVAIEDAGFEVRDSIAWMYGSGFPKSLDVSKAITAKQTLGNSSRRSNRLAMLNNGDESLPTQGLWQQGQQQGSYTSRVSTPPPRNNLTNDAQQWQGWGTALKPAFEPIVVARKPLIGTVAENVLRHGTGALNIDASRIGYASDADKDSAQALADLRAKGRRLGVLGEPGQGQSLAVAASGDTRDGTEQVQQNPTGRWPANVILDESQAAELDRQSGVIKGQVGMTKTVGGHRFMTGDTETVQQFDHGVTDSGGASRFFYVPKANASERPRDGDTAHPTVKPLDLMRYLVKLVTPPGGTVLEPFAGSGTTLEACVVEGFHVIGIELTEDYLPLITQRLSKPIEQVLW